MSTSETGLELEKLRAEVAALRKAKGEAASGKAEPDAAAAETGADTGEAESAPGPDEPRSAEEPDHHIKGQLEELTDLLEAEIRDLPTITCLAVFAAGVLLGRFLR